MEADNYSDEDNFTFNVKTDFTQSITTTNSQTKHNSKKEKKEKYLEKKLLKSKRKREKTQTKKTPDATASEKPQISKEEVKNSEQKFEAPADIEIPLEKETKIASPAKNIEKDHLYDELNSFYNSKDNKLRKFTKEERSQQNTKKKELEKEIAEELKEVKESKTIDLEKQQKKRQCLQH